MHFSLPIVGHGLVVFAEPVKCDAPMKDRFSKVVFYLDGLVQVLNCTRVIFLLQRCKAGSMFAHFIRGKSRRIDPGGGGEQ
jgi:hypothetical protein